MHEKIKSVHFDTITMENGHRYRAANSTEQGKMFHFRAGTSVEVRGGFSDTTLRAFGYEIKVQRC